MNYQKYMYAITRVEQGSDWFSLSPNEAVVLYVHTGSLEVTLDRRPFYLGKNEMLVIQAKDHAKIHTVDGQYTLIGFCNYRLVKKVPQLHYEPDHFRFVHAFISYENVSTKVVKLLQQVAETQDVFHFQQLIAAINCDFEKYEYTHHQHTFEDVIHYIKEHAHENITRDQVANRFGYNANYFSERFKKEVGWGFNEFLTYWRLEKSKILLLDDRLTIQQVAKSVGYQDGLYFSRKFKQQIGMAPSIFRNHDRIQHITAMQFTGTLLAIGITPVAVFDVPYNVPDVLQQYLPQKTVRLKQDWLKENALTNVPTDLIITSLHEYPYKTYTQNIEKIAPSIAMRWATIDRIEEVRLFGKLFKREAQAEQWITRYKQQIAEAKYVLKSVLPQNETVALYELRNHDRVGIWRSNSRGSYNLYEMLQLTPPELVQKEVLSLNRGIIVEEKHLAQYAADHMFVVMHSKEQEHRFFNEVWQQLPAMQKERVYVLRLQDFWSSEGVALEEQLRIQMQFLCGDVKSDIYL